MKKIGLLSLVMLFAFFVNNKAFAIDVPRPEYPRPQFEREAWVNLNGTWTFTYDYGMSGMDRRFFESKGFEQKITVPFCPESRLSGVANTDFIPCIWYHKTLDIPAEWEGQKIILHFGAIDFESAIWINGKKAFEHLGGSSSFEVDITRYAAAGSKAQLVVRALDDVRSGKQTGGKQCTGYYSGGCSYTRVTGIWQTVWMEAVNPMGLKRITTLPDIDQQQLVIRPEFYTTANGNTITVEVSDCKKTVSTKTATASDGIMIALPIKKPQLWTPETPFLYDVRLTVKDAQGKTIDEVKSYAGMRKVHCANGYFYLNNKPYFQRLVLDQGYYPDGIWTAPTDAALKQDIEMSKAVGFNGARLHQKVFEERYYYWADKLGYITWGEEASWGLDVSNQEATGNFIREWQEIVARDRNHPSLVAWTPLNETWGVNSWLYTRFVTNVYDITKAMDPTRPVNDASGDSHVKTDLWTVHDYTREYDKLVEHHTFKDGKEPAYRNVQSKPFLAEFEGQPYMIDEFGGLGWIPKEERANSWGYGAVIETEDDFFRILEQEVDAIKACKKVVGFCYTQITDVEQEKNGVYYYDRRPKFDAAKWKAIFEKIPSYIEIEE